MLMILLLAGLLTPSEVWAQLQVQPARNAIGINESLRVEIILEEGDPDSLDLTPLERNFEIVARARGSQVNIINGSMSKINTWSLRLLPRHSGELTLPELCAASSCSEPVVIEVSDAPATPDDAEVILEHGSVPQQVYVGQQILYTVRLLFRTPLQQAFLEAPEPQGVDAEVIRLGEDKRRETYRGGWRYDVIERTYAIIPAQSGTLHIPPVSMEAQIEDRRAGSQRGRRGSLFEPFGTRSQRMLQRTAAAQIEVEPPAHTQHPWLPAQELKLHDSWEENPPQLRVGEPATRTISVDAQGTSAQQLSELPLEVPSEFKLYPDQAERENLQEEDNLISARLRQSAAIVPREAGAFTLPGITLHWWDLRAQRWSTARIEPREVKVLPAERASQEAPPATTPPAGKPDGNNKPLAYSPNAPEALKKGADDKVPRPAATSVTAHSPSPSTRDHVWVGMAGLCALGWLVTFVMWWRTRKRLKSLRMSKSETAFATNGAKKRSSIEEDLLKAAQHHDAESARHLLHQWAAIQYPTSPTPLDSLCNEGGMQHQKALRQLDDALYSANPERWNGEELAAAIYTCSPGKSGKVRKGDVRGKDGEALPPLYPRA